MTGNKKKNKKNKSKGKSDSSIQKTASSIDDIQSNEKPNISDDESVNSNETITAYETQTTTPYQETSVNEIKIAAFEDIRPDISEFSRLLQKQEQTLKRSSIEELRLQERYAKKSTEGESKLGKAKLQAWSKLYGYKDVGQLSLDIDDLKSGKLPSKAKLSEKELVAAKEEVFNTEQAERRNRDQMRLIEKDLTSLNVRKETIAEKSFFSGIEREVSDIPTKTNMLSRERDTSVAATLAVKQKPFTDYTKVRIEAQKEQERLGIELLNTTDISTPEGQEKYQTKAAEIEKATKKTAKYLALERAQKKGGLDIETQYERVSETIAAEEEKNKAKEIKKEVATGKYSLEEETKKLNDIFKTLTDTAKKLEEEMKSTAGATETTREELEKTEKSYKDQKKKVSEIEANKPPTDTRTTAEKWGQGLQTVGNVASIVADTARYGTITSEIQQRQAKAGVVDIVNQEYFDYRSAAKGDMAALRRVSGEYRKQEEESEELRLQEKGIIGTEAAAGATSTFGKMLSKVNFKDAASSAVIGAASGGILGAKVGGGLAATGFGAAPGAIIAGAAPIVGGIIGAGTSIAKDIFGKDGATELAQGASQTTKTGVDFTKGISQANTYIQATQSGFQLSNTINKIPDYQRQELSDYGRNMYATLQGFGVGANQTFESFASKKSLDTFANLGFDPTQTQQLVGQAAATMGGAFTNASVDRQQEITQRAATLDQNRVMSAQQYMGNMGQLTQVGGGSKQMEEIMANAVARGVGNAKNISEMVGLVSNISAKSGASTAAGTTALVNRTMSNLASIMPGAENEALRRATTESLTARTNEMITGTGMDWASVVGMAHINTKFAGASQQTKMNIKDKVDLDTIEEFKANLADDSPEAEEKVKNLAKAKGVAGVFYDKEGKYIGREKAKGVLNKFYEVTEAQMVASSTVVSTAKDQNIMKKHYRGEALTPAEEIIANDTAVLATGRAGAGAGTKGTFSREPNKKDTKVEVPPLLKRPGPIEDQQQLNITRSVTDVKGLTNEGKTDVLAGLGQVTKDLAKAMDNFKPDTMHDKAVQAADQMTTAFKAVVNDDFARVIGKFETAVDRLLKTPTNNKLYNGPLDNRQQQPLQVPTNQKGPPTVNQK